MDQINGFLQGVFLASFIQLMELDRKSCMLTVRGEGRLGFLYIIDGRLVDAISEKLVGEEAAFQILCWDDVEIKIESKFSPREPRIKLSNHEIHLEAYRRKDEQSRVVLLSSPVDTPQDHHLPQLDKLFISESMFSDSSSPQLLTDIIMDFSFIPDFQGLIIFNSSGEEVCRLESINSLFHLVTLGALVDRILTSIQQVSAEIGAGCDQITHIMSEEAHYFLVCIKQRFKQLTAVNDKNDLQVVIAVNVDANIWLSRQSVERCVERLTIALTIQH